jgi:L-rhamnose mutarotase
MMKLICSTLFLILLFSCKNEGVKVFDQHLQKSSSPVRYGMVTGLNPNKIDDYKRLHASPWPEVQKRISECNIRNYSIYLQKIDNQYFLFSYFEYTGSDFDADMKKMAADSMTQKWWKETDPCQLPLKEALAKHQIWSSMEEVFHQD